MGDDTNNAAGDDSGGTFLQKEFHDLESIAANSFWQYLKRDIETGDVFPAVRKGELQFYYGGGRILRFAKKRFFCNDEYLGERQEGKNSREKTVPLDRPSDTYELIKRRCQDHWNKENSGEARATAQLFKAFSFAKKNRTTSSALIDIEVRFPGLGPDFVCPDEDRTKQDKIDLLFQLPSGRLCFVEVKRVDDARVRAREGFEPEFMKQLARYRAQLGRTPCGEIYDSVLVMWSKLLDMEQLKVREAFGNVPLLLLDPNQKPRDPERRIEYWQHEALKMADSWTVDCPVLVINGTKPETAVAAIDSFLAELDRRWVSA